MISADMAAEELEVTGEAATQQINLGLPKVKITFEALAERFIRRSERGTVLLILRDAGAVAGTVRTYTSRLDLTRDKKSKWSDENKENIGLALSAGPHKVIAVQAGTDEAILTILDRLKYTRFDYMVYPAIKEAERQTLVDWVREERLGTSHPERVSVAKVVLPAYLPSDGAGQSETAQEAEKANAIQKSYVILFAPSKVTAGGKEYSGARYCCKVAGDIAAVGMNRSLTSLPQSAVTAVEQVGEPEKLVNAGKLCLVFDGERWKYGRAVNSYSKIQVGQSHDVARIRTIEAMDILREDIARTFLNDYQGQVLNSYNNRMQFCAMVQHVYFRQLAGTVLDPDWDNRCDLDVDAIREWLLPKVGQKLDEMTEMDVRTYPTGSVMFIKANVKLLDAIEDLEMTFVV